MEWNTGDKTLAPTISFDKFTTGDLEKLFNILAPLMQNGVVDSENKAVQDSVALLFKAETGLAYTNEEPVMPEENFQMEPVDGADLTDAILSDLDGLTT